MQEQALAHPTLLFDMLWVLDPTAWLGLLTLTAIQIVLGIDNLLFIAILSARLPARQGKTARYIGLGGALIIRIILMIFAAYVMAMSEPLFTVLNFEVSVRMTNHVYIMIIAVTIAMGLLMWASGFIAVFVSKHPTVVILCLGFLLLIGFSLIMESFHIEVPKGYLYSAIGFSLLIEIFNQASRKTVLNLKHSNNMQARQVAAHLVLRLLGSKNDDDVHSIKEAIVSRPSAYVFNKQEKEMVSRVLEMSSLPVKAVMTARTDLQTIKVDGSKEYILNKALSCTKFRPFCRRQG